MEEEPPDGERRSIRIFLSRESQCRRFSVGWRLPDACGLDGLVYRRNEPNVYCMPLYRINVNRYAYVSCSSFKPLVGAVGEKCKLTRRPVFDLAEEVAGRVACRLPFIVPMMAYRVRKEKGGISS